jgi:UDP-sugar pyrophosphorylase
MTSGDTDLQTRELLAKNQNFGLPANQLFILKQPLVPAMTDNDGRFALEEDGSVQMKPHGHGDVHLLLHRSGTAARWKAAGVRWVVFFQDTNAMVFRCLSAALGVSAARELALNFVTVPRVPGEAVGAICRLTSPQGQSLTANVEYNEMEALLGGRPEPVHATADSETKSRGVSLFPGNINCFVVEASSYLQVLEDTEGLVGEFINPKYQPGSNRSVFAKPTRIESMMQDYAKLLSPSLHASGRVGHSQFDKWTAFSPVKNDPHSGATRQKQGIGTETASTGEADFYAYYRKLLAPAVKWEGSEIEVLFTGIRVALGARVVLAPSMTITRAHTLGHFQPRAPSAISITQRSVLVLDAPGIIVRHLELDGFLKITAPPGVQVVVDGLTVQNRGSSLVPIEELKGSFGEEAKIRGYVHITTESTAFHFGIPNGFGNIFVLNDQNKHIYLVSNSNL